MWITCAPSPSSAVCCPRAVAAEGCRWNKAYHLRQLRGVQGLCCNLHDGLCLELQGSEDMDVIVCLVRDHSGSLGDGGIDALQKDQVACSTEAAHISATTMQQGALSALELLPCSPAPRSTKTQHVQQQARGHAGLREPCWTAQAGAPSGGRSCLRQERLNTYAAQDQSALLQMPCRT